MIRVLLVDDHAAPRQALALLLARDPGVEIAEADSLAGARRCVAAAPPDLAVVDLGLPDGDGAALLRELRAARPGCALLALAATQTETDRAAAAGVPVLRKTAPLAAVLAAIRGLAAVGGRRGPPHAGVPVLRKPDRLDGGLAALRADGATWVLLYPNAATRAVVCLAGEERVVPPFGLADLVAAGAVDVT